MRDLPKRIAGGLLASIVMIGVASSAYAFSPDRPTYTVDHPADHVVFNSITDNPREGDERNFFSAKDASDTSAGGFTHLVTLHDGQELLFRVYVNNNDNQNANGSGLDGSGI